MSVFDIREPWQEGILFMSNTEFNVLTEVYGYEVVASDLLKSCTTADNAIKKMMGK